MEVKEAMQGYVYDAQPQGSYQLQPHQPHQQQHPVTLIYQPQSKGAVPGQPQNIRQWTTGIFECFDDLGECCYCCCCPLCSACSLATQMDECVLGPFCLGFPFSTAMRAKLRAQYGIQGSVLRDVCAIGCCYCCATYQMQREIKNLGYRP